MYFPVAVIVSAVALATVAAETPTCDLAGVAGTLGGLASDNDLTTCQANAGGFTMVMPSGYPTKEQNTKMCGVPECHELIKKVLAKAGPFNCDIDFGTVKMNIFKLATDFQTFCKDLTPAPTSSAPGPSPTTSPTPTSSAPGPSPTTSPTPTSSSASPTIKPAC